MTTQEIIDQDVEQDGLTLADFIEDGQDVITDKVIDIYHPPYQMIDDDQSLPSLFRQPIGKQEQTIRGAVLSLGTNQGTTIVGEMGTGKTILGIVSAHMAGFKRVLISLPASLDGEMETGSRDHIGEGSSPCDDRNVDQRSPETPARISGRSPEVVCDPVQGKGKIILPMEERRFLGVAICKGTYEGIRPQSGSIRR